MKKSRKQPQKHVATTPTHIWLKKGLVVYGVVVFVLFVCISLSAYALVNTVKHQENQARLNRINAIYTSLSLGDSYRVNKVHIFGDKRVYEWDKGRTYSSSIEYGHNATMNETFADIEKKAKAVGFEPAGRAYEGSTVEQHHYKNSNGEYIRVTVSNRVVQDSMIYGTEYQKDDDVTNRDTAPVYVTIKVNLDDNNE